MHLASRARRGEGHEQEARSSGFLLLCDARLYLGECAGGSETLRRRFYGFLQFGAVWCSSSAQHSGAS
jgi:hypothetical protein